MKIMRRIFIVVISLSACSEFQAANPAVQKSSPILEWASIGKIDKIQQYEEINKKKGTPIEWNFLNASGQTPLMLATINGHQHVVDYLLKKNADRSIKDSAQKIAADYAAEKKHDQILFLLLNTPDGYTGETLLTQAIKSNNFKEVQSLIQRRANVHLPRADGVKPLILALKLYPTAKDKDAAIAVINALIQRGAKTDIQEAKTNKTVLHLAIEADLPQEIIEKIIQCTQNVEAQDSEGDTPLHYAAQFTNSDAIDMLYKEGVKVLSKNKKDKTPRDVVGAKTKTNKINQITALQNTLDFYAQTPHSTPRPKNCITQKSNDETDKNTKSAATVAAGSISPATAAGPQQKTDAAEDRKKNENAALEQTNAQGQSLLTEAAAEGNAENVTKLLDIGALVNAPDANGDTALLVAVKNYSMQPPQYRTKYLAIIEVLLKNKASLLFIDSTGKNSLHIAVENEEQPVVQMLLKSLNVNNNDDAINAQDINRDTPLHYAAAAANPALIKALLDRGADKSITNNAGKKALDIVGTKDSVALMHSNKTATQKLIDAGDNKKEAQELLRDEWDETRPTRGRTQSVFQAPKATK